MELPVIQSDCSLKAHNTFAVEACAKHFCNVNSVQELINLSQTDLLLSQPKCILGEGSNTLFVQNVDGIVLKNAIEGLTVEQVNAEQVMLTIGSGVNWHSVVMYAVENELYGIENLSLIPGTIGAAPIQNIGAYGVELCDVFHSLEAFDFETGSVITINREDCQFGYRDSVFKNELKNKVFITCVRLLLSTKRQFKLEYYALQDALCNVAEDQLTIKMVSDAVVTIRNAKLPDPKQIPNAGSFFKNPIIPCAQYNDLKERFSQLPSFAFDKTHVKIPAAWLIDQCGWKGKRMGSVGVHDQQALVLVNHGEGDGAEILELAMRIQSDVDQLFQIKLTPEVGVV